mgnify:CR=1 FL=1
MAVPRTTHTWLAPLYDYLDDSLGGGADSATLGLTDPTTRIGNATGVIGMYGTSGIAQIATGSAGILSATYIGASGFASTGVGASGLYTHLARYADNGGSGTPYTVGDIVTQLKNLGILKS